MFAAIRYRCWREIFFNTVNCSFTVLYHIIVYFNTVLYLSVLNCTVLCENGYCTIKNVLYILYYCMFSVLFCRLLQSCTEFSSIELHGPSCTVVPDPPEHSVYIEFFLTVYGALTVLVCTEVYCMLTCTALLPIHKGLNLC